MLLDTESCQSVLAMYVGGKCHGDGSQGNRAVSYCMDSSTDAGHVDYDMDHPTKEVVPNIVY